MEKTAKRRNSGQMDKKGNLVFEDDVLEVVTLDTHTQRRYIVKYGEFRDANAISDDWMLGWYIEGNGVTFTILQEYDGERQLATVLEVVGNVQDNPELLVGVELKP